MSKTQFGFAVGFAIAVVWAALGFLVAIASIVLGVLGYGVVRVLQESPEISALLERLTPRRH